ncbi:MAG: dihydroorotase [Bacteroidia bacterium]
MGSTLIRNARIVNEGKTQQGDLLIRDGRIEKIADSITAPSHQHKIVEAEGLCLLPGVIDNHVHFREPGVTRKANIYSESRAAVAGGVTSFMEMPNTVPNAVTLSLLEEKFALAQQKAFANYSFYLGATNDNLEEIKKADPGQICGIKVFMGSSTGNMLVDDEQTLGKIFSESPMLIATHCETEEIILRNLEQAKKRYGADIPFSAHPEIRSVEACLLSSQKAVELARKNSARLHILHLTTAEEISLFTNKIPLADKKITTEVCVHFLWFDASNYNEMGSKLKCNPAIKEARHREALMAALLENKIDIVCSDHAPHLPDEKNRPYLEAPAGIPLVQHTLPAMLEFVHQKKITLEQVVEKMCHAPAMVYQVAERGFIREGYFADLTLVDPEKPTLVEAKNIYYKCGWSPFEGEIFHGQVLKTWVNGKPVWENGTWGETAGQRLQFNR